jgi:hypothetical protein
MAAALKKSAEDKQVLPFCSAHVAYLLSRHRVCVRCALFIELCFLLSV